MTPSTMDHNHFEKLNAWFKDYAHGLGPMSLDHGSAMPVDRPPVGVDKPPGGG